MKKIRIIATALFPLFVALALAGCAGTTSPDPLVSSASAAAAVVTSTAAVVTSTAAPVTVTVTAAPSVVTAAPSTVTAAPSTVTAAPSRETQYVPDPTLPSTTSFNPNGGAQYVGSWYETWNHGNSSGTQYHDNYVVTQTSGGNVSITCLTHSYTITNVNPLGGSLTFDQVNDSGIALSYYLVRSGSNLTGSATFTAGDTGTVDVDWTPYSP